MVDLFVMLTKSTKPHGYLHVKSFLSSTTFHMQVTVWNLAKIRRGPVFRHTKKHKTTQLLACETLFKKKKFSHASNCVESSKNLPWHHGSSACDIKIRSHVPNNKKHEAASETQCIIVRVKHVEPLRYFAAGSAFAP